MDIQRMDPMNATLRTLAPPSLGKRISTLLIGLICCALTLLSGCDEIEKEIVPKQVVVEPVTSTTVPIYGNYIGLTEASVEVDIRARVDGFVEEMLFTEGAAVKAGDILYRIDNRPYFAVVQRRQANRDLQQAVLQKAQRDVQRLKPLYEQDAASQLDYDNALSTLEQARATLAASEAELKEAELELDYTKVQSTIDGLVSRSEVGIGALVGSGGQSLLTRVKQVDPIYVTFNMSSLDYLNARRRLNSYGRQKEAEVEGKSVEGFVRITLPDNSEYPFTGNISFTAPQVNSQTGTFEVRAVLPNPNRELLPGQYTQVRIKLYDLKDAIVIPEKSLQVDQGGVYVMVVLPNNRVERRFLVVEYLGEHGVVVKKGLSPGELVITEGMHRIRHGQLAEPLDAKGYQTMMDEKEKAKALEQQSKEQQEPK